MVPHHVTESVELFFSLRSMTHSKLSFWHSHRDSVSELMSMASLGCGTEVRIQVSGTRFSASSVLKNLPVTRRTVRISIVQVPSCVSVSQEVHTWHPIWV